MNAGAGTGPFRVEQMVRMREGLTVSRNAGLGSGNAVTWFALGAGTDISQESYDRWAMYVGSAGRAVFLIGPQAERAAQAEDAGSQAEDRPAPALPMTGTGASPPSAQTALRQTLAPGCLLIVPGGTLCGMETAQGAAYTEILWEKEPTIMNEQIKPGTVLELKNLVEYQEGSVVNYAIVNSPGLRYALMAFDAGTGLQPHRAPGDAIVTAIEGSGVIGYEGEEFELKEGESFRFAKGGLHSVTARDGRFKMSLLLVRE